jgi:NAD(P)-dependent dehydrogenase (short-subunit alcohol dehydrogenase family)
MTTANNVMLITGGSRGIGAATALLAAQNGWDLAISYHAKRDAAEAVVSRCREFGVQAFAQQCEVADEGSVLELFAQCDRTLGTLGCLVNNAGILFPVARLEDMDVDRVRRVTEVNTIGAFLCAREAVRRMATDRGGHGGSIVNVSSAASYLGSPNEFVDYAMSKGAVDTMTIGLAKEVADRGIRVNGVRPGLIDTDIHADAGVSDRVERLKANVPMGRGGHPDEVAALILYLAGDGASYVTGANINVAGGR